MLAHILYMVSIRVYVLIWLHRYTQHIPNLELEQYYQSRSVAGQPLAINPAFVIVTINLSLQGTSSLKGGVGMIFSHDH